MRRELVEDLVCPLCGGKLVLEDSGRGGEVTTGALLCGCGRSHAIEGGIPRFGATRGSRTARSFGLQWQTFHVAREDEDEAVFQAKTGLAPQDIRGKRVLDAGCGGGRYARVAARWGGRVYAVDLSEAVRTARSVCPQAHVIQADLGALPFRERFFDVVYSIGVLHHTPDTREYLSRVVRHLAPDGIFSVWLYRRWRPALELINNAQRAVTKRLPLECMMWLAEALEPVGRAKASLQRSPSVILQKLGVLLNVLSIGVSMHPVKTQRICDTFDWYTPEYQWHHTEDEVRQWLSEEGFTDIENLQERPGYFYHAGQGDGVNFRGRLGAPRA